MTRVVIAEDHPLVRQSLVALIESEGYEVVGQTDRGDEALNLIRRTDPDLVVLDIGLPGMDGLGVAAQLTAANLRAHVLLLTAHEDAASIRAAMGAGVDGYVPKSASTDELVTALRTVAAGEPYLSPALARQVMALASGRDAGTVSRLTPREREVLELLARGSRPTDVAATLFLSLKTVKNHLTSIYSKLGVGSAAQAVAEAYRQGVGAARGLTSATLVTMLRMLYVRNIVVADTRTRILDAAFAALSAYGLGRMSLEDVAREAGLSRQTVYRYFRTKNDLITAAILREEETFIAGVRAASEPHRDLRPAVEACIRRSLEMARAHPLLDRLLESEPEALLPFLTTGAGPVLSASHAVMVDLLGERLPHLSAAEVHRAADTASRLLISYAINPPDDPIDEVASGLADLLVHGLKPS